VNDVRHDLELARPRHLPQQGPSWPSLNIKPETVLRAVSTATPRVSSAGTLGRLYRFWIGTKLCRWTVHASGACSTRLQHLSKFQKDQPQFSVFAAGIGTSLAKPSEHCLQRWTALACALMDQISVCSEISSASASWPSLVRHPMPRLRQRPVERSGAALHSSQQGGAQPLLVELFRHLGRVGAAGQLAV
jgi:hypothetical protein